MPDHPTPSPSSGLPVPPAGFETHYKPPQATFGLPCVDCHYQLGTSPTFTGEAVCSACRRRRSQVADLLGAIVRGAIPEDLVGQAMVASVADELERTELRDHIDVLAAALAGRGLVR